jgi:hypothetical protein
VYPGSVLHLVLGSTGLAGLLNPLAREFVEMQYLTEEPLILDGNKFNDFFGKHYPTRSNQEGIRETLEWMRSASQLYK